MCRVPLAEPVKPNEAYSAIKKRHTARGVNPVDS